MNRPKVLITNPTVSKVAFDLLENFCDLVVTENVTRSAILEKVEGVDAIMWSTKVRLDSEILDKAGPQMKTVSTVGAGYDVVDVEEFKKRGIKLGNTPEVLNDAVADVAILLVLATSRRLNEGRLKMEQGEWDKASLQWLLGLDIRNATVGIVGLGNIGQAIAKRLQVFKVADILYTGHAPKPAAADLGAKFVNLDTLVTTSDFVILVCPLTNETRGLFNRKLFAKMKPTAILVNVSRGDVVNQEDLILALKSGEIFAAGLDVCTPEPLPSDHELLKLPNVVMLPHVGSATRQTRDDMADLAAKNILRGLGGEEMIAPVV